MKRLFIAIRIPTDDTFLTACQMLHKSSSKLDKTNWIKPENMHITLKFLGETNETKISLIEKKIEKVTQATTPFSLTLDRIGAFGSRYQPRVIWLGSSANHVSMEKLHHELEDEMKSIGFKPDFGNYVTHLTLARIHSIDDKKFFWKQINTYAPLFNFTFKVKEIILLESILHNLHTPEYTVIKQFELKK